MECVWDGHSFMTSREFRGLDSAVPTAEATPTPPPATSVTSEVLVEREKSARARISFVEKLLVAGHTLADVREMLDKIKG